MASGALPRSFNRIRALAKKQSHTITLGELMRNTSSDPESLIRQARWLHEQLPIRFARRLDEFLQLPYAAVFNPHFHRVFGIYLETFDAISAFPWIRSSEDETEFCNLVSDQLAKHQVVARLVAEGYREIRYMYPHMHFDDFLDRFFITRISTRILTENYINMRSPREGYIGVVRKELRPLDVIRGIAEEIGRLTESLYGFAPAVEFRGNLGCTMDYIPRHVQFMAQEILKNALRATADRHRPRAQASSSGAGTSAGAAGVPPVVVELQKGDVHVIIKISDQGGGMSKRLQREAWQYGWTTVAEGGDSWEPLHRQDLVRRRELAGFGFGLPLTRLHAQYFGGDVFMQALPGHGTDMYLLLNHLKEGTPSTETDDPSTALTVDENLGHSAHPP